MPSDSLKAYCRRDKYANNYRKKQNYVRSGNGEISKCCGT